MQALSLSDGHAGEIHLLLSDVVMPRMSGPQLAKRLVEARPQMKVLCMSGYTADVEHRDPIDTAFGYLQKPLTPQALTKKIRDVLDAQ
jgi:two-component system cell cycle sensor histidine kinase/response regulator CckA